MLMFVAGQDQVMGEFNDAEVAALYSSGIPCSMPNAATFQDRGVSCFSRLISPCSDTDVQRRQLRYAHSQRCPIRVILISPQVFKSKKVPSPSLSSSHLITKERGPRRTPQIARSRHQPPRRNSSAFHRTRKAMLQTAQVPECRRLRGISWDTSHSVGEVLTRGLQLALKEHDNKEIYMARQHLQDIRNIYAVLTDLIQKNITRVRA